MDVGDVVTLKSGGPRMTVVRIFRKSWKDFAKVAWFSSTHVDTPNETSVTSERYTTPEITTSFPVEALAVLSSDQQSKLKTME